MKAQLACLTLVLAVAPLSSARGQASADTIALSPVVVTAERLPTGALLSTAATTLLTGAELRARGVTTLLDALRTVPGIALAQLSGPGSQSSLFVRGGNSNFTKVLVDGVPVNAPGGALDISTLTTDNIDRIEIVRGPASVQYGSDAMTGVVQVFTRHEPGTSIAARAGDRDAQYDVVAGTARNAQLNGSTRVSASLGGGIHRGNGFLPFNNQYHNATANALLGAAGARGDASVAATIGDSRYHYPTTSGGTPTDSNAFTGANRLTLAANGRWRATSRLSARAQLGRADTRSVADDRQDSAGDTAGYYSGSHARAIRENADLQLIAALPAAVTVIAGGAVEGQRTHSQGWSRFATVDLPSTESDARRTNRAVYAQLSSANAIGTGDVGVRRERLANGRYVSTGRLGVATAPFAGTIIRASLGTGFKEPAFEEVFNGPYSVGARDLRPERTRSREIGAESRLPGGLVTLGLTAFDQRFTDLVQYRIVDHAAEPDTPDYYNIVAARSRGWEFEGRTAPIGPVALHGSYSFLHTEVTDAGNGGFGAVENGKPLLRRPRRSAVVDARYQSRHATLSTVVNRIGARDDYSFGFPGERVRLSAYTLVEAAAEVPVSSPGGDRWTAAITARAENLTNRAYQNVYGFRTPGRVLFVGVRLRD